MNNNEIWRDVPGFKGLYIISNNGNIISHHKEQPREIKPIKQTKGYLMVTLCKNVDKKKFLVHRLVASAFLDNPDKLPMVNHRNEDKMCNDADNLEYCDAKYNVNYGSAQKRKAAKLKQRIVGIRENYEPILWESAGDCCDALHINSSRLAEILNDNECLDKPTVLTKDINGVLWRLHRVSCQYDENFNVVWESRKERERNAKFKALNKPSKP